MLAPDLGHAAALRLARQRVDPGVAVGVAQCSTVLLATLSNSAISSFSRPRSASSTMRRWSRRFASFSRSIDSTSLSRLDQPRHVTGFTLDDLHARPPCREHSPRSTAIAQPPTRAELARISVGIHIRGGQQTAAGGRRAGQTQHDRGGVQAAGDHPPDLLPMAEGVRRAEGRSGQAVRGA